MENPHRPLSTKWIVVFVLVALPFTGPFALVLGIYLYLQSLDEETLKWNWDRRRREEQAEAEARKLREARERAAWREANPQAAEMTDLAQKYFGSQ